ncbi:acyl-CoA dehydrogenase family protein [Streptomyces sp. NPDC001520]|uniref:acyl-CoA dehydrogenase family protein n=1 Tax=Streptomyces sp. NPDC001520 TaxID=3364581 RepID=UPI0036CD13E1
MTAPAPTLIEAARRLADEVLAPGAESADREGVSPATIAEVKRSGVLGVGGPAAYGGAQVADAVAREVAEILAGACCSTADRPKNTNPNPAVFGVAGAALELLEAAGDAEAKETAQVLGERLREVRREAYALVDEVPAGERLTDRLAVKTRAYDVLRAATTAAIVAGGGRAFGLGSPAQRLAREGLFLVVQGQTADVRSAHLRALRG